MLTLLYVLFAFGFIWLGWKLLVIAAKASWGLIKILFYFVFCPIVLVALVACGLIYLALPILIVVGIISLLCNA